MIPSQIFLHATEAQKKTLHLNRSQAMRSKCIICVGEVESEDGFINSQEDFDDQKVYLFQTFCKYLNVTRPPITVHPKGRKHPSNFHQEDDDDDDDDPPRHPFCKKCTNDVGKLWILDDKIKRLVTHITQTIMESSKNSLCDDPSTMNGQHTKFNHKNHQNGHRQPHQTEVIVGGSQKMLSTFFRKQIIERYTPRVVLTHWSRPPPPVHSSSLQQDNFDVGNNDDHHDHDHVQTKKVHNDDDEGQDFHDVQFLKKEKEIFTLVHRHDDDAPGIVDHPISRHHDDVDPLLLDDVKIQANAPRLTTNVINSSKPPPPSLITTNLPPGGDLSSANDSSIFLNLLNEFGHEFLVEEGMDVTDWMEPTDPVHNNGYIVGDHHPHSAPFQQKFGEDYMGLEDYSGQPPVSSIPVGLQVDDSEPADLLIPGSMFEKINSTGLKRCKLCGKLVRSSKHRFVHLPGNYPCPHCPNVHSRRDNLVSHIRRCHPKPTVTSSPPDATPTTKAPPALITKPSNSATSLTTNNLLNNLVVSAAAEDTPQNQQPMIMTQNIPIQNLQFYYLVNNTQY